MLILNLSLRFYISTHVMKACFYLGIPAALRQMSSYLVVLDLLDEILFLNPKLSASGTKEEIKLWIFKYLIGILNKLYHSFSEKKPIFVKLPFWYKPSLVTGVTTSRNQLLMGLTTQNCGPSIAEKDWSSMRNLFLSFLLSWSMNREKGQSCFWG